MLTLRMKHFLTGEELSQTELQSLLDTAIEMKGRRRSAVLDGKTVALVFEKPSLRTRVSFTVGVQQLGGQAIEIAASQTKKEDPEDTMRVLQGYVDGVMARTFEHSTLERMASVASVPVINGLSDLHHPCQVLADLQTLLENFGRLKGLKVAYIGDGNNMLHSLLLLAPFAGVDVHYSCPEGYGPNEEILGRAKERSALGPGRIQTFATPAEAVADVDAVMTDVWTSMGFEKEEASRREDFAGYQVNAKLMAVARPHALIMHCMPVQKGQEITVDMIEHPRSVLFQQSENRLHAQKALMAGLFEGWRLAAESAPNMGKEKQNGKSSFQQSKNFARL